MTTDKPPLRPSAEVSAILAAALNLRPGVPPNVREGFDRWLAEGLLAGDLEAMARRPHRQTQALLRADEVTRTVSIMSLAAAGQGRAAEKRRLLLSWISRFGGACSPRDTGEADGILASWSPGDPPDQLLFDLTASNHQRVRTFFLLAPGRHGMDEVMQTVTGLRSRPSMWVHKAIQIGVPPSQVMAGADRILECARLSPPVSRWPGEAETDLDDYRVEAAAGLAMLNRFEDALSLSDDGLAALRTAQILLAWEADNTNSPGLSAPGADRFAIELLDRALSRESRWAGWQRKHLASCPYLSMRPPKSAFGHAVMADGRMTAGVLSTFHYHQNWSVDKAGLAMAMDAMPADLLSRALREGGPKRLQALKDVPEIAAVLDRRSLRAAARARPLPARPRTL